MNVDLKKAIVEWFKTFNIHQEIQLQKFEDLLDGLVLTEIMHKL